MVYRSDRPWKLKQEVSPPNNCTFSHTTLLGSSARTRVFFFGWSRAGEDGGSGRLDRLTAGRARKRAI